MNGCARWGRREWHDGGLSKEARSLNGERWTAHAGVMVITLPGQVPASRMIMSCAGMQNMPAVTAVPHPDVPGTPHSSLPRDHPQHLVGRHVGAAPPAAALDDLPCGTGRQRVCLASCMWGCRLLMWGVHIATRLFSGYVDGVAQSSPLDCIWYAPKPLVLLPQVYHPVRWH